MIPHGLVEDDHIDVIVSQSLPRMSLNTRSNHSNYPSRHQRAEESPRWEHIFDFDTTTKKLGLNTHYVRLEYYEIEHTLCLPQCVPGAAGFNNVVQISFSRHHSWEQISSSFEQTTTDSFVELN